MSKMLDARLHHVCLRSPDPQRLAAFYERVMEMPATRLDCADGVGRWLCRGPGRALLIEPGPARTLAFGGYRFADDAAFAAFKDRLSAAGVATGPAVSPLLDAGAVTVTDPIGTRLEFGRSEADRPRLGRSGRLQHLVVATPDPDPVVAFYTEGLGFKLSDVVRDGEGGLRACFLHSDNEHHSFAVFRAPETRLDHHCYESASWDAIRDWADHFAGAEVALEWGPGRHGPGHNLFLMINDADGNWIEISSDIDRITADWTVGVWAHEPKTLNSWGHAKLRS